MHSTGCLHPGKHIAKGWGWCSQVTAESPPRAPCSVHHPCLARCLLLCAVALMWSLSSEGGHSKDIPCIHKLRAMEVRAGSALGTWHSPISPKIVFPSTIRVCLWGDA